MVFRPPILLLLLLIACTSTAPESGERARKFESLVTRSPSRAKTLFEQAPVSDAIIRRHRATRERDLRDGVVRWTCRDVPGVSGADSGQEYCEYAAVNNRGKAVETLSDLQVDDSLSCLFTSIFSDVRDLPASRSGAGSKEPTAEYRRAIARALASHNNIGSVPDERLVMMTRSTNSRALATEFVAACSVDADKVKPGESMIAMQRLAACYRTTLGSPARASHLIELCDGTDLGESDSQLWRIAEESGVKLAKVGDEAFEHERDIAASLRTATAAGVPWRNSDVRICSYVARLADECGVRFGAVPTEMEGFRFTGWSGKLPPACRYAELDDVADIDGLEVEQLVICDFSREEVRELPFNRAWSADVQRACRERFAGELLLEAPLRALTAPRPVPRLESEFCRIYAEAGAFDGVQ